MAKKKTKKRKVISDYRRKLKLLETQKRRRSVVTKSPEMEFVVSESKEPVIKRTVRQQAKEEVKQVHLTDFEAEELAVQAIRVKKDLRKTVVFSLIGFAILFGLYFFAPL